MAVFERGILGDLLRGGALHLEQRWRASDSPSVIAARRSSREISVSVVISVIFTGNSWLGIEGVAHAERWFLGAGATSNQ
jgi:hypothetical protein